MNYQPPFIFKQRHINTVYTTLFRRNYVDYQRERISTPDDDFIDLDWLKNGQSKLVILCHGLEGSADSEYIKGMAKAFTKRNYDIVAYNYRGCSGETNRQLKAYHAGATYDLQTVIDHVLKTNDYQSLHLVGFSLGGNLVLKYLGERPMKIPKIVKSCVAISVPIDLESCAYEIKKPHNYMYNQRFMRKLRAKVIAKKELIEQSPILDYDALLKSKSFLDFDNLFTAPAHGFKDALDYWTQNSSKQFLTNIEVPTLLINALDDPFLAPAAFPFDAPKQNPNFQLLAPKYGGHVGFVQFNKNKEFWSEVQTTKFVAQYG
jgi:predicted alpha/beta-fold hydrolase